MAKKLTMLALRLMLLQIVSIMIMFFLLAVPIEGSVYYWIMTVFMTLVLYYFVWRDVEAAGQKDSHNDRIIRKRIEQDHYVPSGEEGKMFKKWFGFAAGLLSQTPAILLLLTACVTRSQSPVFQFAMPAARFWYFTFSGAVTTLDKVVVPDALPYLMFLCPILFAVVAGLGYLHGPAVEKKLETIIERNKLKKPKRVQDEWAAEKKRAQHKNRPVRK